MTQSTPAVAGNIDDAEYAAYLARVNARFLANTANGTRPLFMTDVSGLFETYLQGFLEESERQHHNCNACRHFIERFGGLVTIDENGATASAIWDENDAPDVYKPSVAALARLARRAKVTGVFLSSERTLGQPTTGQWRHFHVCQKNTFRATPRRNAFQAMAEKREDYGILNRALVEFEHDHVKKALQLLRSNSLYRSDRVLGVAEFLDKLYEARARSAGNVKANVTWLAVATAPAGYCHPRSTMIGTLLEDLQSGLDFDSVSNRFAAKMAAENYQRAQVAPSAGSVAMAEQLFQEMGLAPALQRRYARRDELPKLWSPVAAKPEASSAGVFGHLKVKSETAPEAELNVPAATMTWDKFQRTVLPDATSIEAMVPSSPSRFMALVTAANSEAPPLLAWDRPEQRNPVSWYYASGIDAEIRRRVTNAGGQYENVDIRASLIWNNRNDLDLHVHTPGGEHIYYAHKRGSCCGWLDVDMNITGETTTPVENTRWSKGTARPGRYVVAVWNFRQHDHSRTGTPFRVELEIGGRIMHIDGQIPYGNLQRQVRVAEFDVDRNGNLVGEIRANGAVASAASSTNSWGLTPGKFVPVTGLVQSPNLWGDAPMPHYGRHLFWLLEGCRDTAEGVGRGFFTETLRGELREVRSVLEAYTASAVIDGAATADACGLGMTDQTPWDLTLRVRTSLGTQLYKIDRWD